jgi:hypothetical protein
MSKIKLFPFLFVLFIAACSADTNRETPTQGSIQIAADPSVIRISQEFADGFNFLYQKNIPNIMMRLKIWIQFLKTMKYILFK